MRDFDLLEPESVREASRMMADRGDDCRLIAGGTALLLGMRQRMLTPTLLVSLNGIGALRGIAFDEHKGLRIGALTRHAELAREPVLRARYPMLADMASRLANPQIRNQGTIGGNLCYADPTTDPPGCLLALGASVVLASHAGERVLPIEQFVDFFSTALLPGEIVTEIRVPTPPADHDGRYRRFLRTAAEHRPLLNVSLAVRRSGVTCHEARIVIGASTPKPARARRAEALLGGRAVTAELAAEVAAAAAAEIEPMSDARGTAEHRRDMVRVIVRRTIEDLFGLGPREGLVSMPRTSNSRH